MKKGLLWTALVGGAYLLGSVSWSVLIVRRKLGIDIRDVGSGNPGATNVLRTAGSGPAALVLALDVGKGALPVLAGRALGVPGPVVGAAATAAVVGHIFPASGFFGGGRPRGGKGVAAVSGAMICLSPVASAMGVGVFGILVGATGYVSLGSIVSIALFPGLSWMAGKLGWSKRPAPGWLLEASVAMGALVIARHHENIHRLMTGTEHKLGRRVPAARIEAERLVIEIEPAKQEGDGDG